MKFLKWLGKRKPTRTPKADIISPEEHGLTREDIHLNAQKVMQRLTQSGFEAYLVGGGVRDLLVGKHPKDFDVSTNATPEQVKKLFRNCRLIGRRFRLAHIYFHGSTIEVSTFRAAPKKAHVHHQHSNEGMIIRDNVYGSLEDDVWRRDLTINALYYDMENNTIIDFVGGMKDLKNKTVRIIDDPATRYREDPVRMLRAIRFAAKLNMNIEEKTAEPIKKLANLLDNISASRLFDETLKLFHGGAAQKTFGLLQEHHLLKQILPLTDKLLSKKNNLAEKFMRTGLGDTDKRISGGKTVAIPFLFAIFLWHVISAKKEALKNDGIGPAQALSMAARETISAQNQHTTIPKRLQHALYEICLLQTQLETARARRIKAIFNRQRFRAAYDLLLLRAHAGEPVQDMVDWWKTFQQLTPEEQDTMIDDRKASQQKSRKSPPKKRNPS